MSYDNFWIKLAIDHRREAFALLIKELWDDLSPLMVTVILAKLAKIDRTLKSISLNDVIEAGNSLRQPARHDPTKPLMP